MKIGLITFPGSNCDRDAQTVMQKIADGTLNNTPQGQIFGIESGAEVVRVWHGDADLPAGLDMVMVPGGFSYGDYLRAGAMAAHSPVMQSIKAFAENGGRVIGICNGFQILCEAGLLPGTLMQNAHQKFVCKTVWLRVEATDSNFTSHCTKGELMEVPVAHHEGNYFADAETLKSLEANNQILFRYSDADGNITDAANPNGAIGNIAGIRNAAGNVLGMMPHPERIADIRTKLFG